MAGTLAFYAVHRLAPQLDLGRTIGPVSVQLVPPSPLGQLFSAEIRAALIAVAPQILFVALAIAVVATFESQP